MLVRNKTGVRQTYTSHGVSLPPDTWVDVPFAVAVDLLGRRAIDIQHSQALADYTRDYLYWLSPFSMGDGYATAAENMIHALTALGRKLHIAQCWFVIKDGLQQLTLDMLATAPAAPALVGLCMATPGEFHKLPTPCKIGLTMYETGDPLEMHPEWRHQCNEVDLLIVPSAYCKEVFAKFVKVPIEVVPLAVNPIYYIGTTFTRPKRPTFTFVTHGTLSARKSPLELIACFKRAFPREKDVRLILKTRSGMCGASKGMLPDLNDSRIQIVDEDYYPQDMLEFLKAADAYVFPTKGEGYGLPPREAMATGLPTIFSNNTGLVDLANHLVNWPIPSPEEVRSPIGGKWYAVNEPRLIEAMRWVYQHQAEAKARGIAGAEWFIQNRGAETSALRLVEVLDEFNPGKALSLQKKRHRGPSETIRNGAAAKHKRFFAAVTKAVPTTSGVILDIGVSHGEGVAFVELTRRGYHVVGLVRPATSRQVLKKLMAAGIKKPHLLELPLPDLSNLRTSLPVVGCVCHSTLQNYTSLAELHRILAGMLHLSKMSFVSVPTVRYPDAFCEGARLYRPEYWQDVLADFAADFRLYGADRQYVRIQLLEEGSRRPTKRRGRITDGTWRQAR